MNRLLFILLVLISMNAKAISVSFQHGIFMSPPSDMYVETYMLFSAEDLRYSMTKDSAYQARVELTYIFERAGKVAAYSKMVVNGPTSPDTLHILSDFIDQQRFFLSPGKYDLFIGIKDMNNKLDSVRSVQVIEVPTHGFEMFFSDVFLVDRSEPSQDSSIYERSGTNYYPRVSPYYASGVNTLQFYAELYNASDHLGDGEPYLLTVSVISPQTEKVVGSLYAATRVKARKVEPVVRKLNISDLPTGSYILLLEARNKNNELLVSRSLPFKRFNDQVSLATLTEDELGNTFVSRIPEDSLREMCFCMVYRGSDAEIRYIRDNWKKGDETELRRFMYSYWQERNPLDPELEWLKYHDLIRYAVRAYGNNTQHGCASDRGRIYLKYGKPSSMSIVRNEPHAYPYEIWHYYRIPEKSNAKFFFFDPKRLNEYTLAHSNVMGEPKDPVWYTRVVAGTPGGLQSNQEHEMEAMGLEKDPYSHGSRALDYWNNPR